MLRILIHIIAVALTILLLPSIIPGIIVSDPTTAFIVAVFWGVITLLIRPILMLLTLPINLITLGLFSFVVNAGLLLLVASLIDGFEVSGFIAALLGAAALSAVSWLVHRFV